MLPDAGDQALSRSSGRMKPLPTTVMTRRLDRGGLSGRVEPHRPRGTTESLRAGRGAARDADPGIWYAELLGLEREVAAGVVLRPDFDAALEWFARRRRELDSSSEHVDLADDGPTWRGQVCALLPRDAYQGAAARTLHAIWLRVHSRESSQPLPDFLHPGLMPVSTEPVRTVVVSQVADRIVARPIEAGPHSDSPLGLIPHPQRTDSKDRAGRGILGGRGQAGMGRGRERDPFGAW